VSQIGVSIEQPSIALLGSCSALAPRYRARSFHVSVAHRAPTRWRWMSVYLLSRGGAERSRLVSTRLSVEEKRLDVGAASSHLSASSAGLGLTSSHLGRVSRDFGVASFHLDD
jgi:hypothetical protein